MTKWIQVGLEIPKAILDQGHRRIKEGNQKTVNIPCLCFLVTKNRELQGWGLS